VGESELAPADRLDYEQAQELIQFFSQNLFITQDLSGNEGEYFTREQTLKGVEKILSDKDETPNK
jgi:F-type H+-transporting ATPase subunit beta